MNQLALTFSIDPQHTLDTMEAVLAIARRGGLQLGALQLGPRAQDGRAYLELQAPDPDLLDLFLARLHNLIGVADIAPARQELPAQMT